MRVEKGQRKISRSRVRKMTLARSVAPTRYASLRTRFSVATGVAARPRGADSKAEAVSCPKCSGQLGFVFSIKDTSDCDLPEPIPKDGTQESGKFGNELGVAIQKRQHILFHIDILTSHTEHYSVDA
jgi:hypothetical protein